jgi:hypothetical protein
MPHRQGACKECSRQTRRPESLGGSDYFRLTGLARVGITAFRGQFTGQGQIATATARPEAALAGAR